jgi:hypothetical protein
LTQHPNAKLILAYLEEVGRFLAALEEGTTQKNEYKNKYIADDILVHYPGRSDLAGWYKGEEFYREFGARLGQYKTTLVEIIDVLASDARAAVIAKERLEASDGHSIDFVRVAIYRIVAGQIAEMWVREDDQYAMDEFLMGSHNAGT